MTPSTNEISYGSSITTSIFKSKIIVLGDQGVGKSAFVNSYLKGEPVRVEYRRPRFRSSSFSLPVTKMMEYENRNVEVHLHDTAGQERYRSLTTSYFRGANGCLLFFNVHNQSSFDNLSSWLDDINRYCSRQDIGIVLVGIKNCLFGRGDNDRYSNAINISSYKSRRRSTSSPSLARRRQQQQLKLRLKQRLHGFDSYLPNESLTAKNRDISSRKQDTRYVLKNDDSTGENRIVNNNYIDITPSGIDNKKYHTLNSSVRHRNVSSGKSEYRINKGNNSSKNDIDGDNDKNNTSHTNFAYNNNSLHDTVSDGCSVDVDSTHVNGVSDDEDNAEENDTMDRVISEEQAMRFAYNHQLPYREVDLENDFSSVEAVMTRLFDGVIRQNRRCSVFLQDSVFLHPSFNKATERSVKRCCTCMRK